MNKYLEKTDEELLAVYCQKNDSTILSTIFIRHVDTGFRTAMRYMRNQADAEDVLQLAFIHFSKSADTYHGESATVKTWLMKIIVNTSLGKLREEKRSQRREAVAMQRFNQYDQKSEKATMAIEQNELKDQIKSAVETLPEKYRSPICLVLYEGFNYSEAASILSLPEQTVRTQVTRGLKRLQAILKPLSSSLSIPLIINLMAKSELEAAPISIKDKIESMELPLQQSTPPRPFKSSRKLSVASQTSSSLPIFLWSAAGLCAIVGFYFLKVETKQPPIERNIHTRQSQATLEQTKQIKEEPEQEINKVWDFSNEVDRNLEILYGSWDWSPTHQGMVPPIDQELIGSLKIEPQEKPILVEATVQSLSTREKYPNLTTRFEICWVKNQTIPTYKASEAVQYKTSTKPLILQVYIHKNYICAILPGNKLSTLRYEDHLTDAEMSYFLENYAIMKISCRTIQTLPEEIQKAIDTFIPVRHCQEVTFKAPIPEKSSVK